MGLTRITLSYFFYIWEWHCLCTSIINIFSWHVGLEVWLKQLGACFASMKPWIQTQVPPPTPPKKLTDVEIPIYWAFSQQRSYRVIVMTHAPDCLGSNPSSTTYLCVTWDLAGPAKWVFPSAKWVIFQYAHLTFVRAREVHLSDQVDGCQLHHRQYIIQTLHEYCLI
jgi:hypothetical protein